MLKVAIYARVSTADQDPDLQLQPLRDYAFTRNFRIEREYVDRVTGNVGRRRPGSDPGYRKLLDDARRRVFQAVIVWKFDRFARSLATLIETLHNFSELNIQFISITEAIDTTTASGRAFYAIVGAFAEYERELIAERVKAGIATARQGGRAWGPKRDERLEAQVMALHAEGLSLRKIAARVDRSPNGVKKILDRNSSGSPGGGLTTAPRSSPESTPSVP